MGKRYRLGASAGFERTIPEAVQHHLGAACMRARRSLGGLVGRAVPGEQRDDVEHGWQGRDDFWALRDVTFDVEPGQVIGVIGRNGAGKSTLLKILSQITDPSEGRAVLRGKVASLLEVGTGFHPELTGRENIYLNGSILGMTRREIACKFDAIVDFSGVEAFLDTPIKRYSTGMAVRLAFAVAAHLDPQVLIVDEVLAVGDASFQKKCIGKMKQVATDEGRTVLFVSHNMDSIVHLSTGVLVLDQGRTGGVMPVEQGVRHYFDLVSERRDEPLIDRPRKISTGHAPIFAGLSVRGDEGHPQVVQCGGRLELSIELANMDDITHGECGVIITNEQGQRVVVLQSRYHAGVSLYGPTTSRVTCTVPELMLVPGTYHVDLNMVNHGRMVEYVERAESFEVVFADVLGTGRLPGQNQGHLVVPCRWRLAA